LRRRHSGVGAVATAAIGGGGGADGGEDVVELKDCGVAKECVAGQKNVDQGWGGGEELQDGINVASLAIPTTDAVASLGADQLLPSPCSVNDSNDYDHIASAMLSGTLHAANDNKSHTNQRASAGGENNYNSIGGRNTSTATQLPFFQSFSWGGSTSGDKDNDSNGDDDISCPLPPSTSSSSTQNLCGQQHPLNTASSIQKETTMIMKQVHPPFHNHQLPSSEVASTSHDTAVILTILCC
jgi:hypothetical protein